MCNIMSYMEHVGGLMSVGNCPRGFVLGGKHVHHGML